MLLVFFFNAGGDSKALMFVQISMSENDVNETLCSLNFASRVRGIELGLAKKQFDCGEIFKYKQMVCDILKKKTISISLQIFLTVNPNMYNTCSLRRQNKISRRKI